MEKNIVLEALQQQPLSSRELTDICKIESTKVILILEHLLEHQQIKLTPSNQYTTI